MTTTTERPDLAALDVCQKIEEAAREIYLLLARAHRGDTQAAALWNKTAAEEEQHAQHFRLLQERFVSKLNVDLEPATKALRFVEFMFFRYRGESPTVRQALLDAIALEEKLEEFHAAYAVEFSDESVNRLFQLLMAADKGHKQTLQEELDRRPG